MDAIRTKNELLKNISTVSRGLRSRQTEERIYYEQLIIRGVCFVICTSYGRTLFAPSRFIGYKENTPTAHQRNRNKEVVKSEETIQSILKMKWNKNDALNEEYQKFCRSLGLTPREKGAFGVERKFIDMRHEESSS